MKKEKLSYNCDVVCFVCEGSGKQTIQSNMKPVACFLCNGQGRVLLDESDCNCGREEEPYEYEYWNSAFGHEFL